MSAERIARAFHKRYEQLAPAFGWVTQEASRTAWEDLPEENRRLMVATVLALIEEGIIVDPGPRPAEKVRGIVIHMPPQDSPPEPTVVVVPVPVEGPLRERW